MLTHTELPGLPPPSVTPPICVRCEETIVPEPPADWGGYGQSDLDNWEATLPACGAAPDAKFPDPLGKETAHSLECPYSELPPVVMWFMDEELANRMHRRLWEARQPCLE